MLAIDLNNQMIFIVGAYFINTMNVVFIKIKANLQGQARKDTKIEVAKCRRRMTYFLIVFLIVEVFVLGIKIIIYQVEEEWDTINAAQAVFLCLHAARVIFPVTLEVLFFQQMRVYLA